MPKDIVYPDIIYRRPDREYAGERGEGYPSSSGGGMDDLINGIMGFRQGMSQYSDEAIRHLKYISSLQMMEKGFNTRRVTVGTTPTLVFRATQPKAYIFINPASSVGTTTTGTLLASASRSVSGNTQATPVGVANFMNMHLFLNISVSGGGTINISTQAKDALSGNWANSQNDIFSSPSAVGISYAGIGTMGVVTDFAASWVVSAGSSTFSLGYVLKDGISGTAAGASRIIYIGANSGITAGANSAGFPLLEGDRWVTFCKENTEIWAIAEASVSLAIVEMQ